jgi:hypothetical protein
MWQSVRRTLFTIGAMSQPNLSILPDPPLSQEANNLQFNNQAVNSNSSCQISTRSGQLLTARHQLHITKVAFAITMAFSLCWIPFSCVQFVDVLYPWDPVRSNVGDILVFIGISNSFMNPIIYACIKQDFRRALISVFLRRV